MNITKNPVGRPLLFKTPEELQGKIDEFYKYCEDETVPLTIGRLAVFLDVDREFILNYGKKEKYSRTIIKVRDFIEAQKEERLNMGKGSTIGIIFDLKNNHGWKDKQEIEHTGD